MSWISKAILIFLLSVVPPLAKGDDATLARYKRLKRILMNFNEGFESMHRLKSDIGFFNRAEEKPGYSLAIVAAWNAGHLLHQYAAELSKWTGKSILVTKKPRGHLLCPVWFSPTRYRMMGHAEWRCLGALLMRSRCKLEWYGPTSSFFAFN